eukprot:39232-Pyramimonas_sp.AAC.2
MLRRQAAPGSDDRHFGVYGVIGVEQRLPVRCRQVVLHVPEVLLLAVAVRRRAIVYGIVHRGRQLSLLVGCPWPSDDLVSNPGSRVQA